MDKLIKAKFEIQFMSDFRLTNEDIRRMLKAGNLINPESYGDFANDVLLFDKCNSLESTAKYKEIICDYFNKLPVYSHSISINEKYALVLAAINELWINSRKNPSIFKTSEEFEAILQRIPSYRDHFIHSFSVFVLGHYVTNKLLEINPDNCFRKKSNNPNLTWMLTATFHDVAYPIQESENWINDIFKGFVGIETKIKFRVGDIIPTIYSDFMRLISQYHKSPQTIHQALNFTSIDWGFYNEINSKFIEKEHGVLAGLFLAHLLAVREKFGEGNGWDFLYNHLPACHAICVHNLLTPIKFEKHPFAFLLALCDEIQDVGRPSTQVRKDNLILFDIDIVESEPPEICFKVLISESRKKTLQQNFSSKRLLSNNSLNVVFKDKNENEFYRL